MVNINQVVIRKTFGEDSKVKAIVSVTLYGCIAVHEIRIIQSDRRLFVAMPSRTDENGTYRDIIHPISPEARQEIEDRILDAYEAYLADAEAKCETE